jgi:hypothetical protein
MKIIIALIIVFSLVSQRGSAQSDNDNAKEKGILDKLVEHGVEINLE